VVQGLTQAKLSRKLGVVVESRIARMSYGIKFSTDFIPGVHLMCEKEWDSDEHKYYAVGQMKWFLSKVLFPTGLEEVSGRANSITRVINLATRTLSDIRTTSYFQSLRTRLKNVSTAALLTSHHRDMMVLFSLCAASSGTSTSLSSRCQSGGTSWAKSSAN
jgi:hypothetical protein